MEEKNNIVIYQLDDDKIKINVKLEDENSVVITTTTNGRVIFYI